MSNSCPLIGLCLTLLVTSTSAPRAESLTLAELSYEYVPSAELKLTGNEADELQTTAETMTCKLAVPVLLNGTRTMLLNFLTLRAFHQTYQDEATVRAVFKPENLYSFKYGLVFRHVLNDKWCFASLIQPVLVSDLNNIDSDHFALRAGFLFERKVRASFKYGIGLGYSDDYGDEKVLPVLQLSWKPSPTWSVKFDVPQSLDIWYRPQGRFCFGFLGKVTGGHFRIGELVQLSDEVITDNGRVKYSIFNAGPAVGVEVMKNFSLIANAGRSFFRRFEVFDNKGTRLEDSDFENSLFLKVILQYDVQG